VVLPDHGALAADLRAAEIEVLVRPLAVLRRSLMSPNGVGRVVAAWAADAGGLGRLASDPAQRARLGGAAAIDVRTRFARPRLLDEVQALYDRLLAGT
jgi:hypothetical protein